MESEKQLKDGPYGVPDMMINGLGANRVSLGPSHFLEKRLLTFDQSQNELDMLLLQRTQGIHAPLRLSMEQWATRQIGRLPFLPSSRHMFDVITGRSDVITFGDILGGPDNEDMCKPHIIAERSLGLL